MNPTDATGHLVPLSELTDLARVVAGLRKAQRRFAELRTVGPAKAVDAAHRSVLDHERRCDAAVSRALAREKVELPLMAEGPPAFRCTDSTPCCGRRNEYNGFATGPTIFTCPKRCPCHD